jgi:hypothetical protein
VDRFVVEIAEDGTGKGALAELGNVVYCVKGERMDERSRWTQQDSELTFGSGES